MWSSLGAKAKCGPFRAGRCIVLFLVFTCGQSVLIQQVDKTAAGFVQKPEVSPFEAGVLSRVGLDTSQTDAIPSQMIRTQCTYCPVLRKRYSCGTSGS